MNGAKRLSPIPTSLDMDITAEHEQEGVGKEGRRKGESMGEAGRGRK